MGLRYGERGVSVAMVPTESARRHWDIRWTSRRGSWDGRSWWGYGGQGLSRTHEWAATLLGSRGPQQPQNSPFPTPSPFLQPQCAALPYPHPPPPVLAVGQASGGCSAPSGRPIARVGGAAPTPSRRGPGEAGSTRPSSGQRAEA